MTPGQMWTVTKVLRETPYMINYVWASRGASQYVLKIDPDLSSKKRERKKERSFVVKVNLRPNWTLLVKYIISIFNYRGEN